MDPLSDGPWRDSENFDGPPHSETLYPTEDGWIDGQQLREVVGLELMFKTNETSCPRCGKWVFNYGPLRFCSNGCPENMLSVDELS